MELVNGSNPLIQLSVTKKASNRLLNNWRPTGNLRFPFVGYSIDLWSYNTNFLKGKWRCFNAYHNQCYVCNLKVKYPSSE